VRSCATIFVGKAVLLATETYTYQKRTSSILWEIYRNHISKGWESTSQNQKEGIQTCEGPASYRKVFQESEQRVSHNPQAESSEVSSRIHKLLPPQKSVVLRSIPGFSSFKRKPCNLILSIKTICFPWSVGDRNSKSFS